MEPILEGVFIGISISNTLFLLLLFLSRYCFGKTGKIVLVKYKIINVIDCLNDSSPFEMKETNYNNFAIDPRGGTQCTNSNAIDACIGILINAISPILLIILLIAIICETTNKNNSSQTSIL